MKEYSTPYQHPEWRKVRKKVLDRDLVCIKCGDVVGLQVDHIVPVTRDGALYDMRNLQVLCGPCNRSKSNGGFADEDENWFDVVSRRFPNRGNVEFL